MEKLIIIQKELKAPKSQYNSFGKYYYRNVEDILEAAKPLLAKYKCLLYLSDEIIFVEGRHYVKATATFIDTETGLTIAVSASAREEEDKKGMDGSQITGSSSSYARKYALNGLFLIDDTKDADTINQDNKEEKKATPPEQIDFDIAGVEELLKSYTTTEQVAEHWKNNKYLHNDKDYLKIITKRGKELNGTK